MTHADEMRERQKAMWADSAPGWDRHFEWYSANFKPMMEWCCDATELAPGHRVLDIACGTGQPAFTAASRVGPTGSVIATDLSPAMLERARQRAQRMGVENMEFREMDAEHLDFPDASFDAVTFSHGIMFCSDPLKALLEIRRVLKPGGRTAVVVWDEPSKNPYLEVAGGATGEALGASPPPAADAPGAYRFAQPGSLETLMRKAGFSECRVENVPMTIELASVDDYLTTLLDFRSALKVKLDAAGPEARARFDSVVHQAAAPYVDGGRMRITATPLCGCGRK